LAPTAQSKLPGEFAHTQSREFRIDTIPHDWKPRKLAFSDMFSPGDDTPLAILQALLNLLDRFCDLWDGKSAFIEVFEPAIEILSHLSRKECIGLLGPEFKVCITI
jgi:nucleolar protein 14